MIIKNSLDKALEIATKAHNGQVDKAGREYIYHPIEVSNMCTNYEAKIVGLLHDVIEDTDVTLRELEVYFTEEILEAVKLLTKTKDYNPNLYYKNIKNNKITREVKMADLTHNMDLNRFNSSQITSKDIERVKTYKQYYEYLANNKVENPRF